ncbi:MAG: Fic family protein [Treponema sp.]|nr:Fic family protein [Treponema sp.]
MSKYEKILDLWQSWHVASASDIDLRLHNFKVLFAYHSGKIENDAVTYHDTREIFENGRAVGFSGDPRALFEQINQKTCYEFLKHKIVERKPLDIPLLLETHSILTSGTYDEKRFIERGERPGEFKKHDYVIGREEAGSSPDNVRNDTASLLEELSSQKYTKENILKAASYFHSRFENIHPFADGNGRVGRTLLNYFLMINDHPPVIIHDESKPAYYAALDAYDRTGEIESMYDFLRNEVESTWEKTLER